MDLKKGLNALNAAGSKASSNLSVRDILKNLSISDKTIDTVLASAGKLDVAKLPIPEKEKEILKKIDIAHIDKLDTKEGAAKLMALVTDKIKKGEVAGCCH